jgi:hypothetical protein
MKLLHIYALEAWPKQKFNLAATGACLCLDDWLVYVAIASRAKITRVELEALFPNLELLDACTARLRDTGRIDCVTYITIDPPAVL